MEQPSRIKNTLRNTVTGMAGQSVSYLLNFLYRTVFIYVLGVSYLGVQGLFSNILSMLSLAELGIGTAILFSLYKPLAEKNQHQITALMNFYGKAYRIIGIFVGIVGVSLVPFLNVFIKDKPNVDNLELIYILYLADSVATYFLSYKRSIVIADQKGYIESLYTNLFVLVRCILQIALLLIFRNFILTLVIQIVCTMASNVSISLWADKTYPYIKNKKIHLEPEQKTDLVKKIKAMVIHKVGGVVVLSTDNILISSFIGIDWVGIYSNYLLITGIIRAFIQQFSQAIQSSIGNLVYTESLEKSKSTFDLIFFIDYWIYSFCSISLLTLLNPFITIWLGNDYVFDWGIVAVIVLNFYLSGMRQNVLSFRNSLGLFFNDRYKPIFESIINLVASIVLLKSMGIIGVFIGTLISTVTTSLWVEPYILFKHYFKSGLLKYFGKYTLFFVNTSLIAGIMQLLANKIFTGSVPSLVLLFALTFVLVNLMLVLLYHRTKEFKACISLVRHVFLKKT